MSKKSHRGLIDKPGKDQQQHHAYLCLIPPDSDQLISLTADECIYEQNTQA
jgi:hypothetical protein